MWKKRLSVLMTIALCILVMVSSAAAEGATPVLQGAPEQADAVELTLGQKTLGELIDADDATQEQWFRSVSTDASVFYSLTLENLGNSGSAEGIPFGLYDADGEDLCWDYCRSGEAVTVSTKYPVGEAIYARVWGTRNKCIDGKYRMTLEAVPDLEADTADAAGEIESGKVYSMDAAIDQDVFIHRTGELPEYMTIKLSNISVQGDLYVAVYDPDGIKLVQKRTYDPSSQNDAILRMEPGSRYAIAVFGHSGTGNYKLDVSFTQDQYAETIEAATPIEPQADITSLIDGPDDVDYFAFEAKQANEIHAFTYTNMGVRWGLPITVYDQYSQKLAGENTPREKGTATLYFKTENPGTYYLHLTDASENAYGPYRLQYATMIDAHGDTKEFAAPITDGQVNIGQIDIPGDVDCFALEAAQADRQIGLFFECGEAKEKPVFTVTDELGGELGSLRLKKTEGSLVVTQPAGKKLIVSVTAKEKLQYAMLNCSETTHKPSGKPEITVEPTCSEMGEQVDHCAICGVALPAQPVDTVAHTRSAWEIASEADCDTAGVRLQNCRVCGEEIARKEIPAKGHTADAAVVIEATCTEAGRKTVLCSTCGEVLSEEEIPAAGHVPAQAVVTAEATCTNAGEKKTLCAICGETIAVETIAASGAHALEWQDEIAVTCDTDGIQRQVCTICGQVAARQRVASVGHIVPSGYEVLAQASCEADGLAVRTCSVCGERVEEVVIPATGHQLGTEKAQINGGVYVQCTVCGHFLPEAETPQAQNL